MKYKGIDVERIKEIQRVKLPNADAFISMTPKDIENICSNSDSFDAVVNQIKKELEARKKDTEMTIICEMALNYLYSMKDKETADKEAYNKGLEDAWALARKIDIFDDEERTKIFGYLTSEYIKEHYTVQEALAKLEAYEKEQNEIKVGDVVLYKKEGVEIVITRIYGNSFDGVKVKSDQCGIAGATYYSRNLCDCKKTGKHIDIQKILEQIAGD